MQTSQSRNQVDTVANPTPIKRGVGRPRLPDVTNVISPQFASCLSTKFPIPKTSNAVLKDVTNTVGNKNKAGRPRKHPLVPDVTPNLCQGTSTVPTHRGSKCIVFFYIK